MVSNGETRVLGAVAVRPSASRRESMKVTPRCVGRSQGFGGIAVGFDDGMNGISGGDSVVGGSSSKVEFKVEVKRGKERKDGKEEIGSNATREGPTRPQAEWICLVVLE